MKQEDDLDILVENITQAIRMEQGDIVKITTIEFKDIPNHTEYLIRTIYADRIISPFIQLGIIEAYIERIGTTYPIFSRQIRKQTQDINRCISCLKKCDKPCHTINMDNLSYIRKRKDQTGTGKGNTYENKQNPKSKSITALLNAMDELDLSWKQKKSIKDNFKELQPELLTLFTGMVANTFEKLNLNTTEKLIARGLIELLPDRDRDFIKTGKPPKYKSKIDIKDYMSFWNSAYQIRSLKEIFKNLRIPFETQGRLPDKPIKHTKALIPFNTVGAIPFPCVKDADWHEHVKYIGDTDFRWVDDGWVGSDGTMNKRLLISIEEIRHRMTSRKIKKIT